MMIALLIIAVVLLAYLLFKSLRKATGIREETCVCVGGKWQPVADAGVSCMASESLAWEVGTTPECERRYHGSFLGIEAKFP